MFEDRDDTILARWVAGKLSEEEITEFEQSEEYEEYRRILEGAEHFQKPGFEKESLRSRILNRIEQPESKVLPMKTKLYLLAAAASVALVLGIFLSEVSYNSPIGEQLSITLPDGSAVRLNANSELSHKRFFWKKNKKVELHGEGFFTVEKGEGFQVIADDGIVSVLGTQFNVKQRQRSLEVSCYEGSVQLATRQEHAPLILEPGDRVRVENDKLEKGATKGDTPSWLSGRTSYNNSMLSTVLLDLEAQFGVTFNLGDTDTSLRYSGSFTHDDLEAALKTVLLPMEISYTFEADKKVITLHP